MCNERRTLNYIILPLGFICLGTSILVFYFLFYKKMRLQRKKLAVIKQAETRSISDVREGEYVEVTGNVETNKTLVTPEGKIECVYYNYLEEMEKREYDSEGKEQHNYYKVASSTKSIPFYVKDATGKILVEPEKAEIDAPVIYKHYKKPPPKPLADQIIKGAVEIAEEVLFETTRKEEEILGYPITERGIKVGVPLYVLGQVKKQGENLVISGSPNKFFIISQKSEKGLMWSIRWSILKRALIMSLFTLLSIFLIIAGIFMPPP